MGQNRLTPRSIEHVRDEAREVLKSRTSTSGARALKFFAAAAATMGIFGGGVAALNAFTIQWLAGLSTLAALMGGLAFVSCEWARLFEHRRLLRELLNSEKTYEALLSDARKERDAAQELAVRLQMRLEAIAYVRECLASGSQNSAESKLLPSETDPALSASEDPE